MVELFNGNGKDYLGVLQIINKKTAQVSIQSVSINNRLPTLQIGLIQSLVKGEKMDWIIQKAVELGVTEIQPIETRFSVVKLNDEKKLKRHQHWQQVAIAACEQSGRALLPVIHPIRVFEEVEDLMLGCCFFHHLATVHWSQHFSQQTQWLAIGPEGGFSDQEVETASANGAKICKLSNNVLKSETAAIAALSVCLLN